MKRTITLVFLVVAVEIVQAGVGVFEPSDLESTYGYLNKLRVRAGMTEFSSSPELETAAFNHANYLVDNFQAGHYESEGIAGFTGVYPKDRALSAGYHTIIVSENVASDYADSIKSIDGLMSAIYHRLAFLDFVNNEIGVGIAKASLEEPNSHSAYVYNMGNSEYNALCEGPTFSGIASYYPGVCKRADMNIDAIAFDNVKIRAREHNPNIVVWPAKDDYDVPPVFFEELPDPLPDYSVSGYPISVQFNPLIFTEVNVTQFKLYRVQDNHEVQPTRLLNANTDPNKRLSNLQYVLFPLERLEWNTAYRVEVEYTTDSCTEALTWHFKTRSLGVPVFTVQGEGEEILISPHTSDFAIYVPPTADFPNMGSSNYQFYPGTVVETAFEDGNTLRINLSGNINQTVSFSLSGERHFVVKISEEGIEACEPATFSSDSLHFSNLHYIPSPGAAPIVLWADLAQVEEGLFQVTDYGIEDNMAAPCEEPAMLYSTLSLHIPSVRGDINRRSPNLRSQFIYGLKKLQHRGNLQFEVIEW
jgi:hypothetical protein